MTCFLVLIDPKRMKRSKNTKPTATKDLNLAISHRYVEADILPQKNLIQQDVHWSQTLMDKVTQHLIVNFGNRHQQLSIDVLFKKKTFYDLVTQNI